MKKKRYKSVIKNIGKFELSMLIEMCGGGGGCGSSSIQPNYSSVQ